MSISFQLPLFEIVHNNSASVTCHLGLGFPVMFTIPRYIIQKRTLVKTNQAIKDITLLTHDFIQGFSNLYNVMMNTVFFFFFFFWKFAFNRLC